MGIAAAIAKVRKGVRARGLQSVVADFGGQLRSDTIPAPLRPAATRIANMLRVPKPSRTPVPLVPQRAPHAVEPGMQESACPFTGDTAVQPSAASSEVSQVAAQPEALRAAAEPEATEATARGNESVEATSSGVKVDPGVETGAAAVVQPEVAPAEVGASSSPLAAQEIEAAPALESVEVEAAPVVEPAVVVEPVVAVENAEAESGVESAETSARSAEKSLAEVAAKPKGAKTAARSSNRPAAKRSGGKSKKKK